MSVLSFGRTYEQVSNWLRRPPRRKPKNRRSDRPPVLETLESRLVPTGTWTKLAHAAPNGIGTMMLLSDGTVMAQGSGTVNTWYKLTPDASGSYVNGTWTSRASMRVSRLYFGSNVLPDGRVFLVGGEYASDQSFSRSAEIYDPVANSWTNAANYPQSQFGDDPTVVLPDGRVLAGYVLGSQTYIFNPATNSWSATGNKLQNDNSDEETWTKLPGGSILSYNICVNNPSGCTRGNAQRYMPSSGTWVATGAAPNNLSSSGVGYEMGPALLLPDGRVFQIGATGHTAFYTPSSNSWAAGPDVPSSLGADDAPGAMLPNGHVLFAADRPLFGSPMKLFEYDPTANTYTDVTPSGSVINTSGPAYTSRMLVLPSGQVLFTTSGNQLAVWTPNGNPNSSWKPTISDIADNGDGTYTLTGTQLNGLSEGASYGDDAEMSSNYPIVQLKDGSGHVYYARTSDWSSTGVATGSTSVTTKFKLPANLPGGTYNLTVIANGIASSNFSFTYTAAAQLDVSPDTTESTAGSTFSVTVQALDQDGNVFPNYRGTVHFTSSDPQASLPANYTFTAADNGVHTFNVTLKTAGDQTITATDTARGSVTGQATVTVDATTASQFYVATSVINAVAGTAFDVAVFALDPYGNVDTTYRGTITFSSADPYGATLPANYTFQAGDAGVANFAAGGTLYTAGTWDVTATDVSSGITGSGYVNVTAAPATSLYLAEPASIGSGTAFDVNVYAVDPYGNTDTNYQGTVHFTTTDRASGVVLPADYTFQTYNQGAVTFPGGATLITQGDQLITVTDTGSGITGSADVTVTTPGPLPNRGTHPDLTALTLAPATTTQTATPAAPAGTPGALSNQEHGSADRFFTAAGDDTALVRSGQETLAALHLALETYRTAPSWEVLAADLPLDQIVG